jgi:GNAT superfamily N-acetyltransferase
MDRLVKTTHLEMHSRPRLRWPTEPRLDVGQVTIPCPELNRFFYASVGADWWWYDRLGWSYQRWREYVDRSELETWVGYRAGTPAGYFELEHQPGESIELTCFGLLPGFVGQGLGSELLAFAVSRAWDLNPNRLWVHTCTLDHPRALALYEAHGFRAFRIEEKVEQLPDHPLEPWPGAKRVSNREHG